MQENHKDRVAPPSLFLALTEPVRAILELGSVPMAAPLLAMAPRGDGHPVLVLPGFITTDRSTSLLRRFLTRMGYVEACGGCTRAVPPGAQRRTRPFSRPRRSTVRAVP